MKRFFSEFKPLFHFPLIVALIGCLLFTIAGDLFVGLALGIPLGAVFGAMIGLFFQNANSSQINRGDFVNDVNYLCHSLMLADGSISAVEKRYFSRYVYKYYEKKDAGKILQHFNGLENKRYQLNKIYRHIDESYSVANKSTLMYLLIGIVLSDRFLAEKEKEKIYHIARYIGFPQSALGKMFGMFNYTSQNKHQQQEYSRKTSKIRSISKLDQAYQELDLKSTAEVDEIKSAYRKLVKKYHPDRLIKASEMEKDIAEQQFQKIQEAYEYIKEEKRFK